MSYVVNGAEWDFNGLTAAQASARIDVALEFIDNAREGDLEVAVGDDFQERPMYGAEDLWRLFGPNSALGLDRDIANELSAWLSRAPRYSETDWPDGFGVGSIEIGGAPATSNDDVEWVHFSVKAGVPTAILTLNDPAVFSTTTPLGNAEVHFVSNKSSLKSFWREAISSAGDSLASLIRFASKAYPDLFFVEGVLADAGYLSGGYLTHRQSVRHALAALDDWGSWTFRHPPPAKTPFEGDPPEQGASPANQLIEQRFRGFNLDAAPENPNVFKHKTSREAREVLVGGRKLYCEWHIKLQRNQNRIHFHAPVPESGNRTVIGMINEHLPLP